MNRFLVLVVLAVVAVFPAFAADKNAPAAPKEGVRPLGADGKPLNLDFETGTLHDWTAQGDAFHDQPIEGDTVSRRRGDMKSQHQGRYWIGSYERLGDKPQGTLTSVPFRVTHPWASFLIGGGSTPETCVELVRNDTKEVFARVCGVDEENLRRVAVDLRPHSGKEIFIRLVDKHSGGWGHVNFDDFRFHAEKPSVAVRQALPPDVYKNAGLPPEKAAAVMTVPEGFTVRLFAGEPDICQPIAFCLDDRGRLWVAEAYSYPVRRSDKEAKDRILIFEDSDGDGKFDKRTVFMEGLNLVSGLEVGFGGVWIGAAPYFMFVPVKPGEDKPAGKPQILLDGWHYEDTHETLNAFRWGPDGWLYGCHGVFTHSRVGKPGTPDKDRVPLNAAVWRYHPTKHLFEVFAHGTSNPWGLDFDAHGQAFVEACVIPHAFHIIQGGRYHRQAGSHFNPHTYADIQTIADHLHWQGADPWKAIATSDSAGGGHAHCGLMIYQGGAWPEQYCGHLIMGNIHGHRLNMDLLKPKGSGFVASHGPDFLLANDAWARFINMRYGPDGNVYLLDWYDKQACHHGDPRIWDRGNGRIYKICYRGTKTVTGVDLSQKSDLGLLNLLQHENVWYARHAQRLLQERAAGKKLDAETHSNLAKLAFKNNNERKRLRGVWTLKVTGGLTEEHIRKALDDESPHVRGWAVQLALEDGKASETLLKKMADLAVRDQSPVVRLYLASAMQRLPLAQRWDVLQGLLAHAEDAGDPNLPLMYWYALEPLADAWPERALHLASEAKASPLLLPFMVRRIASSAAPAALALVVKTLGAEQNSNRQQAILRAIHEALRGRRRVDMPKEWPAVHSKLSRRSNSEIRRQAKSLAVTFGDPQTLAELRQIASNRTAESAARHSALAALIGVHDNDLAPVLHDLVEDQSMRSAALRGLAFYDDPKTPQIILRAFAAFSSAEKRDALNTLTSRAAYGKALMDAIAAKKIAASDVPAEIVRQLRNLRDKSLDERIAQVWGILRTTPADRARLIREWRQKIMQAETPPDLALGRAVFAKTCQQCHTLYGSGGKVGPDITGSNRTNLDYLLENILDPSAVIPNDYKMTALELKSGRIINGIVRAETNAVLTVVTANETLTIPTNEIEDRAPSSLSMMPDDLLKPLSDDEVRALIAYLRHPSQVPILATADNAKDFFNGKDLTGWDGNAKSWSVENGEIVGKSPGLKRNEFLKSQITASDFRLTLKVKLTPNKENSGIQFRSTALADGEMRGPQADIGAGWWGKLYEEDGRGLLWDKSGEKHIKADEWNDYEIVAEGSRVRTYINGKLCVDLNDRALSRRGIFALQIHAGGPMEVRFKDLKLEVLPVRKNGN